MRRQWYWSLFIGFFSAHVFSLTADEAALHLDWIDPSVHPMDDFYHYANGQWQKEHPIPAEYPSWGSFSILAESIQEELHQLVLTTSDKKIKAFYQSGMDKDTRNELGIKPLLPLFKAIDAIESKASFSRLIADLHLLGVNVLFQFGNMQDYKNSQSMIGATLQGGLSLPDRSYYLSDAAAMKAIRAGYHSHITKMLKLAELSATEDEVQGIIALEKRLAEASMPNEVLRDCEKTYHKMTLKAFEAKTPSFDWSSYFNRLNLSSMTELNVLTPHFFEKMDQLLIDTPLPVLKQYLRWHVLSAYAYALSDAFVTERFYMKSLLTGVKKELPLWKQVLAVENEALGFALGELYVKQYVPKETKQTVSEMLQDIRFALKQDLRQLSWMENKTKQAALAKLGQMQQRIGYPERFRSYAALTIDAKSYVKNIMNANRFNIAYELNKIGQPIDTNDWAMTPQTVNAYYDPSMNTINFPAAILKPPFFDPKAPAAVNYGGIGAVIGHEITHGFDDQGAKFDGKGDLNNWWTEKDLAQFNQATQCISNQFSQYQPLEGVFLKGPLVVGEATADLGGLLLAYRAFHASSAYSHAKTIQGMTPDQQFFLSFAHVWATNIRPEKIRHDAVADPHPTAQYRVNGTLINIPEFSQAFHGAVDSGKQQCRIW